MNNNNLTFNQTFNEYLKYSELKLKPQTLLGIERSFKKHILPFIGNKSIYNFNSNNYFEWQNYIKNLGLSDSFNKNIQIMFKRFYDYLEQFYDLKNIPKKYGFFKTFTPSNKQSLNVWSINEYRKFIKHVDNKIYHALFNLLFFTGVRKGEALALRFNDIDKNYIYINKTITKELFNNEHLETSPKTKKSIRKIRIDRFLKRELFKLRKYYIKCFDNYNDNFYIFGGNKPIAQTTLKRKKDYYCKIANVKQIRIHDFRHSHATILYHKKINIKTIQERLGHADESTTVNKYVHLNTKDEKKVLLTLNFLHYFRFF